MSLDLALLGTAALMGLAGTPHCAAMCGAACIAVGGSARGQPSAAFQLGRLASYAAAGAVAAASVQVLGQLGRWTPLFAPLWVVVHAAALMLGAWLLVRGRQPQWVQQLAPLRVTSSAATAVPIRVGMGRRGSVRAGAAGLL